MIKIMFVCHGNICRSPMAEFVMKNLVREEGLQDVIYVASSATSNEEIGNDTHHGTRRKLKQMDVPFSPRRAVRITRGDYDKYDYIVLMDHNNLRNIKHIIPGDPQKKISLLLEHDGEHRDIADPWYTGNFDKTYDDVLRGCTALLGEIISTLHQ